MFFSGFKVASHAIVGFLFRILPNGSALIIAALARVFPVVRDVVRLNGAFSRVAAGENSCVIELAYHPDDILTAMSGDLARFADNAVMQSVRVCVFAGEEGARLQSDGAKMRRFLQMIKPM